MKQSQTKKVNKIRHSARIVPAVEIMEAIESRFEQIWYKMLSVESAVKNLAEAHRGLIDAQRINTDKLNQLLASDTLRNQELPFLDEESGTEWIAPWA